MKTISRVVSLNQNAGLTLLDWSSEANSRLNQRFTTPTILKRKVPALRIVPPAANEDVFKYASAMKARNGYLETIAFTVLGLSAAGALGLALFG